MATDEHENEASTTGKGDGIPEFTVTQPIWKGLGKRAATTFPPFVPNRIVRETHLKAADGWVSRTSQPDRVHPLEKVPSNANLDRKILYNRSVINFRDAPVGLKSGVPDQLAVIALAD